MHRHGGVESRLAGIRGAHQAVHHTESTKGLKHGGEIFRGIHVGKNHLDCATKQRLELQVVSGEQLKITALCRPQSQRTADQDIAGGRPCHQSRGQEARHRSIDIKHAAVTLRELRPEVGIRANPKVATRSDEIDRTGGGVVREIARRHHAQPAGDRQQSRVENGFDFKVATGAHLNGAVTGGQDRRKGGSGRNANIAPSHHLSRTAANEGGTASNIAQGADTEVPAAGFHHLAERGIGSTAGLTTDSGDSRRKIADIAIGADEHAAAAESGHTLLEPLERHRPSGGTRADIRRPHASLP